MLSKVVERILASFIVTHLVATDAFGVTQWAYQPRRSCGDLLTLLVAQWFLALSRGKLVAIYLSDISGAFDRVDKSLLLPKLHRAGVGHRFSMFFDSYIAPRRATVIVQSQHSAEYIISNHIFQGTVLGPPLWNVFFADCDEAVQANGFASSNFADDLMASTELDSRMSRDAVHAQLRECQSNVHQWGCANRALFDGAKEHFKIIHHMRPEGDPFKYLGVLFDCKLTMADEISRLINVQR